MPQSRPFVLHECVLWFHQNQPSLWSIFGANRLYQRQSLPLNDVDVNQPICETACDEHIKKCYNHRGWLIESLSSWPTFPVPLWRPLGMNAIRRTAKSDHAWNEIRRAFHLHLHISRSIVVCLPAAWLCTTFRSSRSFNLCVINEQECFSTVSASRLFNV